MVKVDSPENSKDASETEAAPARQIAGNLPYTTSIGVFKRALQKITESERPPKFNKDYLNTVFGITGGASTPVIPILKKTGFIEENGTPTPLYAEFQTEGGRAAAAYQALRNGFAEIFKRNTYAHKAEKEKLVDTIVAITGLAKSDRIVGFIYNTFQAFQDYAKNAPENPETPQARGVAEASETANSAAKGPNSIGISYQFNIVLPESTNIEVFNSIFKSLRDNLLR